MTRTTLLTALTLLQFCIVYGGTSANAQDEAALGEEATPGLLAEEPQTAEENFEAALVMLRVSRPDLAKRYLDKMLELEPDDQTLLDLREQHGTSRFFELSRNEDLLPASQQLLERVQQAAAGQLADPAYFDSLIAGLRGSAREREAAIRELKHYGADAVPEILARLGAGADFEGRDQLLLTLVQFGPVAVDPLLGAIDAPDPRTRAVAIDALGWLGDESIIPRLWYPAIGTDQPRLVQEAALRAIARIRYGDPNLADRLDPVGAADETYEGALRHFRGEFTWVPGTDGSLDTWTWETSQNKLIKTATNPTAASMMMAERLARQAMLMAPDRDLHRALFLAATLAHSRYRAGWDQPLPQGPGTAYNLALFSGPDLTEMALGLAIENGNPAAVVGAAAALGAIGNGDLLRPHGERPPALIAALDFPNERVQFAAATAILQLDPTEAFPHAARVVDILARSLRTEAGPRSVIIDPNNNRAVDTASLLHRLGYNTTVALTGREGFCEAAAHGDVALAVLHPNTIRWELRQTIANLRADSRTAGIPIVIAAGERSRIDMLRVLQDVPVSTFVSTDCEISLWQNEIQLLVEDGTIPSLTPPQQQERRQAAAYWLRRIAEGYGSGVFDLTDAETALAGVAAQPGIGHDALIALGGIGRASVQELFVEIITGPAIESDLRQTAARQLAAHIQKHGQLITEDAIAALMDAWGNTADPAMRTALSAVMGTMHPKSDAILNKLTGYQLPDVPQP